MKLLITMLFICAFCALGRAQTVEVSQSYVDDATKAFAEVVQLRGANVNLIAAAKLKDDAIAAHQDAEKALLKIIYDYAASDLKAKKSFWKSAKDTLLGILKTLVDPAMIREYLLVIALIKAGK